MHSVTKSLSLRTNEENRLESLRNLQILDTVPEKAFDDLIWMASQICDAPIALLSIIDRDRQWFKSKIGLAVQETPREIAFCAHAILQAEPLVVPDAREDCRFSNSPLVTDEPNIRFYAGARVTTAGGQALGTVCVIDRQARRIEPDQIRSLEIIANQVSALLELRRMAIRLNSVNSDLRYESRLTRG